MSSEELSLAEIELAYAMNDIVNMKRELKKTYNLISHHAGQARMFEGFWVDAKELLRISGDVAKETGRPTLAFRIKCLLERPV